MKRKIVHFIRRFRICVLFLIFCVAYNIVAGVSQSVVTKPPLAVKNVHIHTAKDVTNVHIHTAKDVTNAHIHTTEDVYSSTYPVFSVIAVNSTDDMVYDIFAVNTWINETANWDPGFCCYMMVGGAIITKKYLRINQRREMFKYVAQVECANPDSTIEYISKHLFGITLSKTGMCTDRSDFVKPFYPVKQPNQFSFALCGKFIFGDINMELTIEWMEYNRYMGVNKVVLYTYNVSSEVSKMLKFYQLSGFADIIPFHLHPGDEESRRPGEKNLAAWNDEQLVVYDCQSRLRGYQYVSVIDLDEFIVPIVDRNFQNMLARLIYLLPNMTAAEVYSEMFVLDWGMTNEKGSLTISQYENRTVSKVPHIDINQRKLIHIPSRVQRGSVITHGCKPLNSSFLIFKDPMSVMSINHYRGCVNYRTGCFIRKRVTDKRIVRFLKRVEIAVQATKQELM